MTEHKYKVTIKEKNNSHVIETSYQGPADEEFVKDWFGCENSDVEWYKIEQIQ